MNVDYKLTWYELRNGTYYPYVYVGTLLAIRGKLLELHASDRDVWEAEVSPAHEKPHIHYRDGILQDHTWANCPENPENR